MSIGWPPKDNLAGKWMWLLGQGAEITKCANFSPYQEAPAFSFPLCLGITCFPKLGLGCWGGSTNYSQIQLSKRRKNTPISTDSLKTNSPSPATRAGCTWKQHQQLKLWQRDLCRSCARACWRAVGRWEEPLCLGKGRRREGTGALLWCAYAGEHKGCKLTYFSLYILHDWFQKWIVLLGQAHLRLWGCYWGTTISGRGVSLGSQSARVRVPQR